MVLSIRAFYSVCDVSCLLGAVIYTCADSAVTTAIFSNEAQVQNARHEVHSVIHCKEQVSKGGGYEILSYVIGLAGKTHLCTVLHNSCDSMQRSLFLLCTRATVCLF
jgi:hypothetical protein